MRLASVEVGSVTPCAPRPTEDFRLINAKTIRKLFWRSFNLQFFFRSVTQ